MGQSIVTVQLVRASGLTVDVFVSRTDEGWQFWQHLLGRRPDLRPDVDTAEWKLHDEPEIALRVRLDPVRAGGSQVGIGVVDLTQTVVELRTRLANVPEPRVKPGIIATVEVSDPDGNVVVVWQDLLRG
jgi:hypothetical protein